MKIISWNVNGLRAVANKGFHDFLAQHNPDILGVQEIKALQEQLSPGLITPPGYHYSYFNSAEKKGYSGTGIFAKQKPLKVKTGLNIPEFDREGRLQEVHLENDIIFFNIYFPNGKKDDTRLQFKLDYYDSALHYFNELLSQGKKLIIAGDYNTAHHPIDLARPKQNESISGFLPIERQWMDKLVQNGYTDCFRHFNQDPDNYTWWSYRAGARPRNVGWRIDYFFCSQNILSEIKNCYHLTEVMGSDHCPIVLEF